MDVFTRARFYLRQRGKPTDGFVLELDQGEVLFPDLTGPQRRRLRQKQCLRNHEHTDACRVPHVHTPGERCIRCARYKAGSFTAVEGQKLFTPAAGPRDWIPGQQLFRSRRGGKTSGPRPQRVVAQGSTVSRSAQRGG